MKFNKKALSVLLAAVILSLTLTGLAAPRANAEDGKWIATWSTSLVDASITISNVSFQDLVPSNSTLRTEIVVTTAGTKLQFVFSNRFGAQPFTINAASLARTEGQYQAKIQDGTQTPITFNNGATAVTIPAGGNVKSDVIDFSTRAMDKLSISLFIENLSYIQTAGLSNGRCYMNAGGFLFGKNGALTVTEGTELKIDFGDDYIVNFKANDAAGGSISIGEDGITFVPGSNDGDARSAQKFSISDAPQHCGRVCDAAEPLRVGGITIFYDPDIVHVFLLSNP